MINEYTDADNYEVTLVIPPEAPTGLREKAFNRLVSLSSYLEDEFDALNLGRNWDLGVCGSPVSHTTELALERAEDTIEDLGLTITLLQHEAGTRAKEIKMLTMRLELVQQIQQAKDISQKPTVFWQPTQFPRTTI